MNYNQTIKKFTNNKGNSFKSQYRTQEQHKTRALYELDQIKNGTSPST